MPSHGEASCQQQVGGPTHQVRTRHYAPGANPVVERFHQTVKYEHLSSIGGGEDDRATGFHASVSGGFDVSESYADGWATSGYEHH